MIQNKNFTNKDLSVVDTSIKDKMILRATYGALICSTILAVSKFVNYFLTGSAAIHASALDSIMDLAVSAANFLTVHITRRKPNKMFPKGFDKIAPLIAMLQVILVTMLAVYLLVDCFYKFQNPVKIEEAALGFYIIVFALVINSVLVWYQSKVVKTTGSLIIKADMLHYKTDFLTNAAILFGIIFITYFDIYWLDPLLGMGAGVYLLIGVFGLLKASLHSLLDINNEKLSKEVYDEIQTLDIKNKQINLSDIYVLFSGLQEKINIKVLAIDQQDSKIIQEHIQEKFKQKVEIIIV